MKKIILATAIVFFATGVFAQQTETEITSRNSWLKAGLSAGVPVGDASDYSNFVLGLDLKGQLMETPHLGIGLTTGYNHFFAKNGYKEFGTVPLGAFIRVYPQAKGFFIGTDLGYSFLTNANGADGGFYVKPQLGYHNYSWNYFAYFNGIFRSASSGGNINHAGIGATYNIRFK
ncbi:MAG: hypothetical protein ABS68_03345 [Niastella sp. SCN 39-18]|nr:hypothetical protein [Sphingobacteriales bacterium]ODT54010.1 MAG: hypothetical protein ABS68_03345 [Niastella sp. SCN 39-18]OJW09833.1 MAG: hypothetical protein BGO53_08340 [Sphingobacteriales bacterium 39-19]